jgi:hypothetical protein
VGRGSSGLNGVRIKAALTTTANDGPQASSQRLRLLKLKLAFTPVIQIHAK